MLSFKMSRILNLKFFLKQKYFSKLLIHSIFDFHSEKYFNSSPVIKCVLILIRSIYQGGFMRVLFFSCFIFSFFSYGRFSASEEKTIHQTVAGPVHLVVKWPHALPPRLNKPPIQVSMLFSEETVKCDFTLWLCGFKRCPVGPVQCHNNKEGFISSDTALKSLKVIVTKKNTTQTEYVLKNPPGSIKDYYVGFFDDLLDNEWVQNQIPNLQKYDEIEVAPHGYEIDGATPLYQSIFMEQVKGLIGSQ